MAPQVAHLPFVDRHATTIATGVDEVWDALVGTLDRTFSRTGAARYARVVGCTDTEASGPRPLAAGSTLPGFRILAAMRPLELVLAGRHRFSDYALIFSLEALGPGRAKLTAETRAAFPGLAGRGYRLLVIGSRGHVVGVRRLLAATKRRAAPGTRPHSRG